MRYIHNLTADETLQYYGPTIASGEVYQIPQNMWPQWAQSNSVIQDITNGKLGVSRDGSTLIDGIAYAILYIQSGQFSEYDPSGRQIMKTVTALKGTTYLADCCEIHTSLGVFSEQWDGSAGNFSATFYDDNNNPLTEDLTTCTMTVVDYSPDHDYEIISGKIHQASAAIEDVRFWVIGGCVDLAAYPGTIKEMVRNVNLRYISQALITDGRASKYMVHTTSGVPYPTNKLRFILTHPAGHQHSLMVGVEIFR